MVDELTTNNKQPKPPRLEQEDQPKQPKQPRPQRLEQDGQQKQPKQPKQPKQGKLNGQVYTVQAGDSWASLAGKFGHDQRKFAALMGANKASPYGVLRGGTKIVIPDWLKSNWKEAPEISNNMWNAVQTGEAMNYGYQGGGGGGQFQPTMDKPVGYEPSYFQDPKAVARWYNLVQSRPAGSSLPDWLDKDGIEQAYKWFEFRNQGKTPDQWGYLPADDPGLSMLAGMATPPPDALLPHEVAGGGRGVNWGAQQPGLGAGAQMDFGAQDFDWNKLNISQKRAIIADKNFSMAEVPMSQQGLILSDPEFDLWGKAARGELPWWQPVAFTAMSSPALAPAVQGVAIGATTRNPLMGMGIAALGYGAQLPGTAGDLFRFVGQGFMWGSEQVEKAAGMADQMTAGALSQDVPLAVRLGGPLAGLAWAGKEVIEGLKEAKESALDEVIQNPGAAFEAGRSFYETQGAGKDAPDWMVELGQYVPFMPTEKDTVWVLGENRPVPVQPGYTLDDARKRILNGESSEAVLMDYQRAYGISGQSSDFLLSSIYDPLNVAPDMAAAMRVKGAEAAAGKAMAAGDSARAAVETMKARALREKPNMLGMSELLPSEAKTAFRDLVRTGLTMEQVKAMTPAELKMAGLTADGAIKSLTAPEAPTAKNLWNLFNPTPESRALTSAHLAKENLGLLMDFLPTDENVAKGMYDILNKAATGDMAAVREMGAAFMDNPEMYTSLGAVRDFMPKMQEMGANFDLAKPNRELFWKVQGMLGEDAATVLKNFTDGDPRPDFEMLVKRAEQAAAKGAPEAKAFMDSVKAGDVSAESMAELFKVFKDNRVPIHPQEFKAQVMDKFYDHMGKWGVDYFGVKQAGAFDETLRMMKGAQSLMLLDFSPSYLVNNFLNNRVMMALGGSFGFTPEGKITRWMADFGVAPARLGDAMGPAGMDARGLDMSGSRYAPESGATRPAGTAQTADAVIAAAKRGDGLATKAADALEQVRKKTGIMSKASSRMEQQSSMQMYYSAMKAFYGRQWRAGVGFARMPAGLEMSLRKQGFDPNVLYRNIEGFMSGKDFERLKAGTTNRTLESFAHTAAERLNLDPADVSEMLNKLGVADVLKEKLAKAGTPDQVRAAFDSVERQAMDALDSRMAQELRGKAEHVRNKVQAEGPAAVLDVFNDLVMDNLERKFENDRIWDEAFARAREATDKGLVNQYMEKAARENSAAWRRAQAYDAAATQGIIEGLGMESQFKLDFLHKMLEQHETLAKFFEEKNREYRKFFRTEYPSMEARQVAWDTLELEFNRKFAEAEKHTLKVQGEMDEMFAGEFGRVFGEQGAVTAKAWRDGVARLSAEMHETVTAFRDSLRGRSRVEREQMWNRFKPEYQEMWTARAKANLDGANGLYKWQPPAGGGSRYGAQNAPTRPSEVGEGFSLNQAVPEASGLDTPAAAGYSTTSGAVVAPDVNAVYQVMAEFGLATADDLGNPLPGAKLELMKIIKKYGDYQGLMITKFADITPEMARTAFENRAHEQFMYGGTAYADMHMAAIGREIRAFDFDGRMNTLEQKIQAAGLDTQSALLDQRNSRTVRALLNRQMDALQRAWDESARIFAELPDDAPDSVASRLVDLQNRIDAEMATLSQKQKVGEAYAKAKATVAAQEAYGQQVMSREAFRQKLESEFKLAPEQAEAVAMVTDARAEAWGRANNRPAAEWYETRLGDVVREKFEKGDALYQIGGQAMSAGELANYARALVRAGAEDVRRAVAYEDSRGSRIALLDAVHKVDPNLAMDVARQTKEMLFQGLDTPSATRPTKGAVSFMEDGKAIIHAFESADVSTALHELGHVFRRDLGGDDLRTVEKWAGVKDGKWARANEEKFARAFEYLSDGKAPTPKLAGVFESFKSWLTEIYRGITGSAVDVPENVKAVCDRLLGGDGLDTPGSRYGAENAATRPAGADQAQSLPRSQVHPAVSDALYSEARKMLDEVLQGEPGKRTAEASWGSTYPDWYGEIVKKAGGKQAVVSALEKIIKDHGVDKGATVERLKSVGLDRIWEGDTRNGTPPDLRAMQAMGASNAQLMKALDGFNEIAGQYYGREFTLDEAIKASEQWYGGAPGSGQSNRGTFDPNDPNILFQEPEFPFELPPEKQVVEGSRLFKDGGDVPLLPVGGYDQMSGYMDVSRMMADGWSDKVRPVLDAMADAAYAPETRYNLGFDDATQMQLNQYLNQVKTQMANTKHAALRYGETARDFALLDYSKQVGFDRILNAVSPYQFFLTRSAGTWMTRVLDRPAWISQYVRMRNMQNTYKNQFPERMRGKMRIPMPFLPEWAGGGLWIDPSPQFLPFTMFEQPLKAYMRDETNLQNSATYIVREWAEDGMLDTNKAQAALSNRSGPEWERAVAEAKMRQSGEGNTGADYFTMMFSPALYMTLPYYLATGKQLPGSGFPGGQLPMTRMGQGLETALKGTSLEFIGDAAGMLAKPEQWVREQKGLHEFGEWGDFYIDRQLANMAAEGKYGVKDVQVAMIEKQGPLYDEARERVKQELMMRVPGMSAVYAATHGASLDKVVGASLVSLFPGGLLPPAEMEYKGLKNEYGLAWDAYKQGDKQALRMFFDDHPEYQARLALRRDPEQRLEQFLRSEIWEAWGKLGKTNQKQAQAFLGENFGDFLGSEPGVEFSPEQLATWVRALGGMVPKAEGLDTSAKSADVSTSGGATRAAKAIDFYSPEVTAVTDRFYKERGEKFPNYYVLQAGYYSLPKSERAAYLMKFPELKRYWDWKDKWYKAYPEYNPIWKGEVFKRVDTSGWSPALVNVVEMSALTGERLPSGAYKMLQNQWVKDGKPGDSFKSWLEGTVYPSMLNGNEVIQ